MIEIKRCSANDLNEVVQAINNVKIEEDDFKVDNNAMTKFLEDNNNLFYNAILDGKVVAYAIAYIQRRLDSEKSMVCLYEIGTSKQHRKQGIAKELIMYMINDLKDRNILKIWIPTNKSNISACSLYKSIGAEESEEKDDIIYTYRM